MRWQPTSLGVLQTSLMSDESMEEVVGKTYELKNAYKQYGVVLETEKH
jgi:adenine deaminase